MFLTLKATCFNLILNMLHPEFISNGERERETERERERERKGE